MLRLLRSVQPRSISRARDVTIAAWNRRHFSSYETSPRCTVQMFNSLTKSIDTLGAESSSTSSHSEAENKKSLKWYACGPTVYDTSHVGHARAYVNQDILLRILQNYFQYRIQYVLGMTDVDDKIIRKSQQEGKSWIDIARHYEHEFLQDMARMNVQPAHSITRVSEHMSEIIAYIKGIESNGFAYEAVDGSGVYFDTEAFGEAYGKLDPDCMKHNQSLMDTSSHAVDDVHGKRNSRDFALWKTSKPDSEYEPCWPSPWGSGRPGWHIECSAMTHRMFGSSLDVHTGGIDLCFPHHNNEIAQCEAFHRSVDCLSTTRDGEWCSHFIHFGHLYIKGLKMSKSLKNFISIQDFLEAYPADYFRMFCLQHKYRSNVHYSADRMAEAGSVLRKFDQFFRSIEYHIMDSSQPSTDPQRCSKRWNDADFELFKSLEATQIQVDTALRNDLDTPASLHALMELVSSTNRVLNGSRVAPEPLQAVGRYILKMLDTFGFADIPQKYQALATTAMVSGNTKIDELDPYRGNSGSHGNNGISKLMDELVAFREQIRTEALKKETSDPRKVLELCDSIRMKALMEFDVKMEDNFDGSSTWVAVDSTEKKEILAQLEKQSKGKIKNNTCKDQQGGAPALMFPPSEFFSHPSSLLSNLYCLESMDENGIPTKSITGEDLSKSARKKLSKKLDKYKRRYEKHHE